MLGKTTLIKLEIRTDDDDRAAGVIDALSEQVLTEEPLLTLQRISERFQLAALRLRHCGGGRTVADRVVDERIHCLLQNTLFVAENDFRRVDLDQFLQAVVAVDDAAIEIVHI